MIFPKYNVQLIAIPRCSTGCIYYGLYGQFNTHNSTVTDTIVSTAVLNQLGIDKEHPDSWLYTHGHYTFKMYEKWAKDNKKIYTFSFVRNPYTRMLSLYSYHYEVNGRCFRGSFEDFCIKCEKNKQFITDWKTQSEYLKNQNGNLDSIDFIGKLENFNEDWGKLKQLQPNLPDFPYKFKQIHKSNRNNNKFYYTKRSQDIVDNMFQEDFELLNYNMGEIPE